MCEKQHACGLFKYLNEIGKLGVGEDCPKPEPTDCVRYKFNNGENIVKAREVFKVQDVYRYELPLTHGETLI